MLMAHTTLTTDTFFYFIYTSFAIMRTMALSYFIAAAAAPPAVQCFVALVDQTPKDYRLLFRQQAQPSSHDDGRNFLLAEFSTYRGEIVDPYKILNVHRTAERREVRDRYINLSRRYHPDVVRHKDILPGSCNNLEEVRDQWERIKLAYEILSDKRLRKRYDRHEVIADPNAAMQRAAVDAAGMAAKGVGRGIFQVGKGIFSMGAKIVADSINNKENRSKKNDEEKA